MKFQLEITDLNANKTIVTEKDIDARATTFNASVKINPYTNYSVSVRGESYVGLGEPVVGNVFTCEAGDI